MSDDRPIEQATVIELAEEFGISREIVMSIINTFLISPIEISHGIRYYNKDEFRRAMVKYR